MNNLLKYFVSYILFVLLSLSSDLVAQDSSNTQSAATNRRFNIFGYPYVFYTPETQLAFGVGGITTFYMGKDKILRPSKVTLSGYYTTNGQYSFNLNPQFYFMKNKYFFSMPTNFRYAVDKYYGIGSNTPEIENPEYTANIFSFSFNFQFPSVFNFGLKSGILFDYKNFKINDRKTNPYLTNDSLNLHGGNTLGLGFIMVWDSRDNIFFPLKGGYHQIKMQFFSNAIGSDYDFNVYIVDLRRYFPIIDENIIGLQVYSKFARGNPPFYELATLGGQYMMRGYYEGRYRDKNYITAQIEYRAYLWWEIGFVGFFAIGNVSDKLSESRIKNAKFSYGFGLRYQFNKEEKVNLRADFGFGKETSGVYFGIEEVF